MHEHTLSSLLLLLQVCPAVLKHPCAYIGTICLVRILHVHMGAAWGPQNMRDIHTQVQIPDSTTVTLSLAPRCLQNLGTSLRLLLAQELQYSELEDVSPHMWELIVQVIVPTQVLAFTVSWVGVQYTLEIVQYTLMPRQ